MSNRNDPDLRRARRRAWLLAAALLAVPAAHAEKADRDKPVNVEADRVTFDDAKQIGVFEGKVTLTQGTLRIQADKIVVRQDSQGFQYATATGNQVYFRQKREGADEYIEGWADRLEYDNNKELVQLFNRAQIKRNQDELRGNYISYNAKTEFFQVQGNATEAGGSGRVKAVIQPKPKAQPNTPPQTQPPVGLKPSTGLSNPPE